MSNVYVGDDEKIHVVKGGADSVLPYKKDQDHSISANITIQNRNYTSTYLNLYVNGSKVGAVAISANDDIKPSSISGKSISYTIKA